MGNIKPPPAVEDERYTMSGPRGRDPTIQFERQTTFSTGRGGAGNINRSAPSNPENDTGGDVLTEMPSFTTEAARTRSWGSPSSQKALSTGRGGAGNIIRKNEQPSGSNPDDRFRSLSSSRSRNERNEANNIRS
ncbi:hypothetical protein K435DRAFT_457852 [Dendrothele bispora CBS 962.96]|uniref:Uncharacterized protein n=1 Tax=Dendrothele bispora (strain CBS 962.96) TaxID=1314807 RepID=A0A4S8L1M0_DENBC|nr:hypothetical protein K435DRAFT_457852 [Dendrothele bispora CBS 962.96]